MLKAMYYISIDYRLSDRLAAILKYRNLYNNMPFAYHFYLIYIIKSSRKCSRYVRSVLFEFTVAP